MIVKKNFEMLIYKVHEQDKFIIHKKKKMSDINKLL